MRYVFNVFTGMLDAVGSAVSAIITARLSQNDDYRVDQADNYRVDQSQ